MEISKESNEIVPQPSTSTDTTVTLKRLKRKRKRIESNSDSSEDEPILPDNYMEVEKNVHAAAVKNNLSEKSVKHIIKKVVTNDHVLALVQLREEEEGSEAEDVTNRPKLTRSKAKELMKCSPKSAPWNIELTPIKHIPVKTRPEVTALIDQDLPDESDEEYEPTPDDVVSDDDHTIESSSDIDSQPRTPVTPRSVTKKSTPVVKDGPFKVPQDVNLSVCRRLDLEEEAATIALRTRSKLCLSETPIEHIESSFVPPDELPQCEMDSLWNQFLSDLDNPALNHRNEEDDDDPEYNAANDPDAHDEDEEALENSIIKISKKELNDLVTEIFHIMPEGALEQLAEKNINNGEVISNLDSKKGLLVDETPGLQNYDNSGVLKPVSILKSEMVSDNEGYSYAMVQNAGTDNGNVSQSLSQTPNTPQINACGEERNNNRGTLSTKLKVPPILQDAVEKLSQSQNVEMNVPPTDGAVMLPEQVQILQQQLRQHVQVAACNFLQLFIHPIHWSYAPNYKQYLETLYSTSTNNPNSVVNVCNLRPAVELIRTWEKTVGDKTPENEAMLAHIENETIKYRRRHNNNGLYVGEFHEMFQQVVANSSVFLYPYLLPVMPYKPEKTRRIHYCQAEDELIALGMSEFWDYIEENPDIYPPPAKSTTKSLWSLAYVIELVAKYMFPWLAQRALNNHIHHIRKMKDPHNPINRFLHKREIVPVKHKLMSFNPNINLYEQPVHEMPFIWVKYIGKNSKRAKEYISKRSRVAGRKPEGVEVKIGERAIAPKKDPLPIHFTKTINVSRTPQRQTQTRREPQSIVMTMNTVQNTTSTSDVITQPAAVVESRIPSLYSLVQTSTGAFLMPLQMVTDTSEKEIFEITNQPTTKTFVPKTIQLHKNNAYNKCLLTEHCSCCKLIRNIIRKKQTVITNYFRFKNKKSDSVCPCRRKTLPLITNKLRILLDSFRNKSFSFWKELYSKVSGLKWHQVLDSDLEFNNFLRSHKDDNKYVDDSSYLQDLVYVTNFQLRMWMRISIAKSPYLKKRVHTALSSHDMEGSPTVLAQKLERLFGDELTDFFPEFLVFLTEAQVEKLDRYKDYFIQNNLEDFMNKIQEEVKDTTERKHIIMRVSQVLSLKLIGPCYICSEVLPCLSKYPKLAEYFFSLFPHRHADWESPKSTSNLVSTEHQKEQVNTEDHTSESDKDADSETSEDQSSNEATDLVSAKIEPMEVGEQITEYVIIEELSKDQTVITELKEMPTEKASNENKSKELATQQTINETQSRGPSTETYISDRKDFSTEVFIREVRADIKQEYISDQPNQKSSNELLSIISDFSINDTNAMVVDIKKEMPDVHVKAEIPDDYDNLSDASMRIVSDDEASPNWTREEDEQVLRVLQLSLSQLKLIDKTVEEVLIDNNIYDSLSNVLNNKSPSDIKNRVLYLLDLLLLSENK